MGKKRGVHITGVKELPQFRGLFIVEFARSKCKYARVRMGAVQATDELGAAIKFKRRKQQPRRSK